MGVVFEYPIILHVDNIGAIFLPYNTSSSQRTKHIDVCHNFICNYVKGGTVKNKFFSSEGNIADPFTNNLSNGSFESHTSQ